MHPQVGHLVTQRFDPLLEECLILAIFLLASLQSLENISHVEDVALVFLPLLLEILLLVSDGGVEEENQVVLLCDGALQMRKGGLYVLLLALGLVVQFLHFLLEAQVFLAQVQHFLVVLTLQCNQLVLVGFDYLFQFLNDDAMASLIALYFYFVLIVLVLLHIGPQLVDLVV